MATATRRTAAAGRSHLLIRLMAVAAIFSSSRSLRGSMRRAGVAPSVYRSLASDFWSPAEKESSSSSSPGTTTRVASEPPFAFAACLILQDDNKILPEWLAYHYHFLPLRHLVVSADPGNVTSPESIFDLWRARGMQIDVWPGEDPTVHKHVTKRHWEFIPKCLRYLQRLNRTWTAVIDTDEYVVFNRPMRNEGMPWECRGGKKTTSNATAECVDRIMSVRRALPEVGRTTAAAYIHEVEKTNPTNFWRKYACVTFPRVFFGSRESPPDEVRADVPPGFNGTAFQTLRYRYYTLFQKPGKSIVDVTRYDGVGFHNHRVMGNKCSSPTPFPPLSDAAFRVHHYTPSLEVYLGRPNDWRRNEKDYRTRTDFKPLGADDGIRGWLSSFVDSVGTDAASELTERTIGRAFVEDAKVKEALMKSKRVG